MIQARVCLSRPDGEFVCDIVLSLEGLPKGQGAVYSALIPAETGVGLSWRVTNYGRAFRVTSARPEADQVRVELTPTA